MSKSGDSVARWRGILRDQVRSGLSAAAYCRRVRVPLSSFYFWRRKLRYGARAFAEVRVVPEPTGDGRALEVRLPGGRCVVVRPGFDRQTLLDLLSALEGEA